MGINTGLVAVGTAADRGIVIGGEVNIGARLQQAADPGEVLVGSTTRQLVKDAVEFGEMRMIRPKEFDREIAAWPVIRLAPRSTRSTIPFVDRRRELALLTDTFERVQERRRAHLVTLLGEPGIGKTRVVEEFLDGLGDDVTVLSGRPSQFEEQVTFWPLGQMVRERRRRRRIRPDRGARRPAPAGGVRVGGPGGRRQGRASAGLGARHGRGREPREPLPQRRDPARRARHARGSGHDRAGGAGLRGPARGRAAPARPDRAPGARRQAAAAARGLRGALGVPGRAARLGGRARRRRHALGGAARDGGRRAARDGGGRPPPARRAPRGRARRWEPAVHRRDHGHAAPRRGRAAADGGRAHAGAPASDGAGGDRVADRFAVARRARPDPQGVVVRARRVRRVRARAGRRAAQGRHGRAGGRRVPGARERGRRASGRMHGGSGARCCATWRTRAWPSASVSACTCVWRTACRSRAAPNATHGRSRTTWNRPRSPRWT